MNATGGFARPAQPSKRMKCIRITCASPLTMPTNVQLYMLLVAFILEMFTHHAVFEQDPKQA